MPINKQERKKSFHNNFMNEGLNGKKNTWRSFLGIAFIGKYKISFYISEAFMKAINIFKWMGAVYSFHYIDRTYTSLKLFTLCIQTSPWTFNGNQTLNGWIRMFYGMHMVYIQFILTAPAHDFQRYPNINRFRNHLLRISHTDMTLQTLQKLFILSSFLK